jgi:uncharacterized repeat protein (TIGR03803 family)
MSKLSLWETIFFLCVLCAVKAIASPAVTFKILVNFDGTNGQHPVAGLVQATNGNFYGTTSEGGADGNGTVFDITAGGKLARLHSFCSQGGYPSCTDGANPGAGLIQATNGNFYGTTSAGGAHGGGTVFEITAGGQLTTLHNFCSQLGCADGVNPGAGLIQATDGNFYGTTYSGGTSSACSGYGCGTVFEITTGGQLTTLHNFCSQTNCTDGVGPVALVQATNGSFYGTTAGGGTGCGTVFEITAAGKLTTLHSFDC